MNIGSCSLKFIDFSLIEGTKITKLSHLRKKKILYTILVLQR